MRSAVVFIRMIYFIKVRANLRSLKEDPRFVAQLTLASNKRRVISDEDLPPHPTAKTLFGLDLDVVGGKSLRFINFLTFIFEGQVKKKKILVIGPRNEGELYTFMGHGFRKKNITSIDLFTYSPLIDIMDMHDLQYDDNSFDVVYAGWVISYSENRGKAIQEMIRVLKPGGIVGVTATLSSVSNEELIAKRGYMVGSESRIVCLEDLKSLFSSVENDGSVCLTIPANNAETSGLVCFRKKDII